MALLCFLREKRTYVGLLMVRNISEMRTTQFPIHQIFLNRGIRKGFETPVFTAIIMLNLITKGKLSGGKMGS